MWNNLWNTVRGLPLQALIPSTLPIPSTDETSPSEEENARATSLFRGGANSNTIPDQLDGLTDHQHVSASSLLEETAKCCCNHCLSWSTLWRGRRLDSKGNVAVDSTLRRLANPSTAHMSRSARESLTSEVWLSTERENGTLSPT